MAIHLLTKKTKEVNKVVLLPLDEIESNPHQPRNRFDDTELQELAKSILTNGLLQPITVRKKIQGGFELVAGERRTKAFRILGRQSIPAIIMDYSDQQSAALALIENLQRKDLNYFEEAIGIAKLMNQLGLTQQQVSEQLGKAQSTVANKLRLLRYPKSLQDTILQAGLTERHARAFLKIHDDEQLEIAVAFVIERGYNVEQTEQYIDILLHSEEKQNPKKLFIVKDMRMFHNSISKAVKMMSQAGIQIENSKKEDEDFIEYTIRIPKYQVYKQDRSSDTFA